MADVKISQLPVATTPLDGTEVLPIVQSATTKQVSIANVTAGRAVSALSLSLTNALPVTSGGTGIATTAAGTLLSSTALNTISATATPTLGVAGTTAGTLGLSGVTSGVVTLATASAAGTWTLKLPTTAGTNNYLLKTDGSGNTDWVNPTALGIDLDVGTTAITGGTTGRVLYDNAGVLGEYSVTGTGTTAVLSTSPTFTTGLTTPLAIGGTTASSSLTLQSTSGVGTSDSILFKVGNNGATTAALISTGGIFSINNSTTVIYDTNSGVDVSNNWLFQASGSGSAKTIAGANSNTNGIFGFSGLNSASKQIISSAIIGNLSVTTAGSEEGVLTFHTKPSNAGAYVSERMRITSTGNVGIASTPQFRLDVNQNSSSPTPSTIGTVQVYARGYGGSSTVFSGIGFAMSEHASGYWGAGILARDDTGSYGAGFSFYTSSGSSTPTPTEKVRITSANGYLLVNRTSDSNFPAYISSRNNGNSAGAVYAESSASNYFALGSLGNNASFADFVHLNDCSRSATSAYTFLACRSNNGSDTEFSLRGDGNAYADGTWNNNGADYAEFFESFTGGALTVGATVVLDGGMVREATEQDAPSAIIGVVRPKEPSKASMVIGNTAWNKWANRYLTDDFDRYIMEDHEAVDWIDEDGEFHSYESHAIPDGIVVPENAERKTHDSKGIKLQHYKNNPAYDPNLEYVPRENRPEWIIVGLMGQVKVLKGQPVNDRWVKMRDVSATVEEWMIR